MEEERKVVVEEEVEKVEGVEEVEKEEEDDYFIYLNFFIKYSKNILIKINEIYKWQKSSLECRRFWGTILDWCVHKTKLSYYLHVLLAIRRMNCLC